jgi:hypothetical protein
MKSRHLIGMGLIGSTLLALTAAAGAQNQPAPDTTVKIPVDQIKSVSSGIRQHGGEILWAGLGPDMPSSVRRYQKWQPRRYSSYAFDSIDLVLPYAPNPIDRSPSRGS